ncbi:MAG TPA: HAD family hydrolase [Clostridiaceae bacterium]|nr:HAD family hydrolase [Clostridiaceae bacterium]
MRKKLVCTDLDGTLLNTLGKIPALNLHAIREVQRQGHLFNICTGRICQSARYYASHFSEATTVIASGGSIIQMEGRTWYRAEQDRLLLERIYDIAEMYRTTSTFQSEDTLYISRRIPEFLTKFGSNKGVPKAHQVLVKPFSGKAEFLENIGSYVFVSLMCLNREKSGRLRAELSAISGISVTSPFPGVLDVTTVPVDKGTSIRKLADHFGISREDIIIFGDGENDLAMTEVAGTSIAMENAVRSMKEKSDRIAPSNDKSGVGLTLMDMFGIR